MAKAGSVAGSVRSRPADVPAFHNFGLSAKIAPIRAISAPAGISASTTRPAPLLAMETGEYTQLIEPPLGFWSWPDPGRAGETVKR